MAFSIFIIFSEYAKPIFNNRWDENSIGFCEQTISDRPAPQIVVLKGTALEGIARKLGLPSHETVDQIGFGTGTAGGFLVFKGKPVQAQNPDHMVLRRPTDPSLKWQHLQTRGWVDDAYQIASFCSPIHDSTDKSCSVRIHFKDRNLSFEARRMRFKMQPIVGQPPPPEFRELAIKLPKVLDLFTSE